MTAFGLITHSYPQHDQKALATLTSDIYSHQPVGTGWLKTQLSHLSSTRQSVLAAVKINLVQRASSPI